MRNILDIKGVTKLYPGIRALDGVDLEVPADGVFGLVGPNGAGKTTLFSVICGFLNPDSGSVQIDGQSVKAGVPPPPRTVSILPQDARFLPYVPIGPQLRYYAELSGFSGREAVKEAQRVLELVDLANTYNRKAGTLSHGMYKRVGIAQAFIASPRLIILDEPTAGLDPGVAREIRATLRTIRSDQTVVVSSHNLLEIEDLCRNVAILHKGRIVEQGRIEDLKGVGNEISFRLPETPSTTVVQALNALDPVATAVWNVETGRLHITVNGDPATVSGTLAAHLAQSGVAFLDMRVGKTLEDRFLAETAE
jgi:ABC-type multidrug transport system ATPase subunit